MPTPEQYRPEPENPKANGFELTDHELLYRRVSTQRLKRLLFDDQTTIHSMDVDYNSFGEFLFIKASRAKGDTRENLSFWGCGIHDAMERKIKDEWYFDAYDRHSQAIIDKDEAQLILQEREQTIHSEPAPKQSNRGKLYEMLAELTDMDGALAELEDLETLWDDLDGDE